MAKSEIDTLRERAAAARAEGRPGEAGEAWCSVGDRLAVRHKDAAVEAYRHAAEAFLGARDPARAQDAADRGVAAAAGARWTHSRVDALRVRAEVWSALGDRLAAVADLRAAVAATAGRSQAPERGAARADLGVALYRVGLGPEGAAELEAAVKLGAKKKWMAPQVARWTADRDALAAAWAAASARGVPAGWQPVPGGVRVYFAGAVHPGRVGPGGVAFEGRADPVAVRWVDEGGSGLAGLAADPTDRATDEGADADTRTETTEGRRRDPTTAPTEV